jgi:hypothetical protein
VAKCFKSTLYNGILLYCYPLALTFVWRLPIKRSYSFKVPITCRQALKVPIFEIRPKTNDGWSWLKPFDWRAFWPKVSYPLKHIFYFSPRWIIHLQDKKLSHHNNGYIIGKRIFGAIIRCVNYSDPHKKGGYYFLRISGSWMPRVRICAKCLVFKVLGFYRGIKDRRIQS